MVEFFPSRAVAMTIGTLTVYWYGLLYVAAFGVGWWLIPSLARARALTLTRAQRLHLLTWVAVAVVVGGRLGYAGLYEPTLLFDPGRLVRVSSGGMASHGGFVAVSLALVWWARRERISLMALADVVVIPVALGLTLGRLGNFINQELYGTLSALPWAIAVTGVEGLRHPVQLYAVGKDILLAAIGWWGIQRRLRPGLVAGQFLVGYGLLRFLIEYVRAQEVSLIHLGALAFTRGQIYTLGVLALGLLVLAMSRRAVNPRDVRR